MQIQNHNQNDSPFRKIFY